MDGSIPVSTNLPLEAYINKVPFFTGFVCQLAVLGESKIVPNRRSDIAGFHEVHALAVETFKEDSKSDWRKAHAWTNLEELLRIDSFGCAPWWAATFYQFATLGYYVGSWTHDPSTIFIRISKKDAGKELEQFTPQRRDFIEKAAEVFCAGRNAYSSL